MFTATYLIWMAMFLLFSLSSVDNGIELLSIIYILPFGGVLLIGSLPFLIVSYPWVVLPLLIISLGTTFWIMRRFKLLRITAKSSFIGHMILMTVLLLGAQLYLPVLFQVQALQIAEKPYCLKQKPAHEIIFSGGHSRMPHAALYTQDKRYLWSFTEMAFIPMSEHITVASHEKACRLKLSQR